jgi:hypothetical protein
MFVRKDRESVRLPGLKATAVILVKVGFLYILVITVILQQFCRSLRSLNVDLAHTSMKWASIELAYFGKPRPSFSMVVSSAGLGSCSRSFGIFGGYLSRPFLTGQACVAE